MLVTTLLAYSLLSLAPKPFDFHGYAPYNSAIPKPESILGYQPGERHTVYADQERVLRGIEQKASDRMKVINYGKTPEGRPLRVAVISSPKNIARLEEIRKDMETLANPKPGTDYSAIIKRQPAFVWINECIHGDETASFESGMWLIYNLAASKNATVEKTLENTVVFVNPAYNPDGHERYVVWYNSVAVGSPERNAFERETPSSMTGRANHYRFDMNRDRIILSQDESRAEVKEFQKWNPQVYVDQHGQVRNYFFPPNAMSQNANADRDRMNKWTEAFGRAIGKNFDKNGWMYFIKDTFDLYYAGYLDSWTSLNGAIGMTHETDGGRVLSGKRDDDTILTLRDGMAGHFVSAMSVIQESAAKREELLTSFLSFKLKGVTGAHAGKFKRVVITSEDFRPLDRLAGLLLRHGIEFTVAGKAWKQEDANNYWTGVKESTEFPAGSLVIEMAQARGQLAKALLEPGSDFEPEFLKEQIRRRELEKKEDSDPDSGNYEFYDLTGWGLPYLFNVKAWWCESTPEVVATGGWEVGGGLYEPEKATVGFWLPYTDQDDILAIAALAQQGVKCYGTSKDLKMATGTIPKGSFLILRGRNEDGYTKKLEAIAGKFGVTFWPITSGYPEAERYGPGSDQVAPIKKPKIGVVFGSSTGSTGYGPFWYLMERVFELDFTPLSSRALNGDLSEYTCIVLPGGAASTAKFKEWVEAGGCAVFFGARAAVGEKSYVDLKESKLDKDKDPPYLPGTLFEAAIDPKSFLSYGYPREKDETVRIAIPVDGTTYYKAKKVNEGAVLLPAEAEKVRLLSGWTWGEDTNKALAGTVWAHEESVGRGRAVIFMFDPSERAMWPGHFKMLLNAMILGS
ncbi:MAG: hypothetical protein KF784_06215 [Fimbriimonadaceae bacterium]|nr:hypothetical protein [Fimbriimonadaceae bacterium]